MTASAWLNPAGGLRYHARALFRGSAWAPFRASLGQWLSNVETPTPRAILVGPSAAHCIPDAFLRRFEALTILEPDPIAGFLLGRRLRRLGLADPRIERADHLIEPLTRGTVGLPELLLADPEAGVVFCNVLGQTRFLVPEPEFARFKAAFRERVLPALEGRAWLSFHDRVSGAVAPSFDAPFTAPARLTDAEVLRELYRGGSATSRTELLDHASDDFFPSHQPHTYFSWQIDGERHHLIEGVASNSRAA